MVARSTMTENKRQSNGLLSGIFFLLTLYLLLPSLVSWMTDKTFSESSHLVSYIILIVMVPWCLANFLYQRLKRGPLLIDLGPRSDRAALLFFSCLLLPGSLLMAYEAKDFPHIFFLFVALLTLSSGVARFQLRKNGMWLYNSLIPWKKIVSYRWMEDSKLSFTIKSFRSSYSPEPIPVPKEKQEAVDRLLQEHGVSAIDSNESSASGK